MYQLEERIHFATNRHLSSPVSKTVLNDDVISCTAGMQTLWIESKDSYPAFTIMQNTDVANSKLTIFINHRMGIGGSVYPHRLDTVPSSGAARLQLLIRRSTRAFRGEGRRVRRDRLLYPCRTTRRRRGNDLPALRTWF